MTDQPGVTRFPKLPRWVKRVVQAGAVLGAAIGTVAALYVGRYHEPSSAMWPTLAVGETFFARLRADLPARGAIAIFRYPEDREQTFVQRVIGLPGDVVQVADEGEATITINDWPVPRCKLGTTTYAEDGAEGDSSAKHEGVLSVEWLGDSVYLVFDEHRPAHEKLSSARARVNPGEYFVIGDNRANSHDSRSWSRGGGVPVANTRAVVPSRTLVAPSGPNRAALVDALAACLAKPPGVTNPPSP